MKEQSGYVYLIGAGCGDMDLITLRGLQALQHCDAVVYDDLIDEGLLAAAPAHAERIYMGKRSGKHSAPQEEISRKLVEKAGEGKVVARLKGGDPFVFGRGGEEALALQAAGIPFEEVPGISSSIAIPASVGIPVTHRGVSRSFHVITGHSADRADGLPEDLEQLASLHGTLVFLMGLSHLEQIADALMRSGKSPDTPAAVISGGNSANPATVRGTLRDIAVRVREAGVVSPAVIVVGEVAAMTLLGSTDRALQGVRVGLTGTSSVTEKLKAGLKRHGALVSDIERSIVEALPLSYDLNDLCDGKCHWIVFTSANGVRLFFRYAKEKKLDLRRLHACRFAVIGKSTGELLEQHGVCPDLCPQVYTSHALARELCRTIAPGEDALLFRADNGAAILPEMLREHEIPVQDISIYSLSADPQTTARAKDVLPKLDYLTFSSAGGVGLFFREHGRVPEQTVCVCIGEVTARALKAVYDKPFLMADEISAEGIVRAIVRDREGK